MAGQPPRIMHVTKSLGLGGTEKAMQLFVSRLNRERFTPAVFSFKDGERGSLLRAEGIPVFVGSDLLSALGSFKPDIAHIHRAGWYEPSLLRTLRLARVPRVVETNVFGRFDPSPAANRIDRHLFVSHFCLARYALMNDVPQTSPKCRVLYNPVDTDFFAGHPWTRDFSAKCAGRLSRPDPGKWSRLALNILPVLVRAVPGFTYRVIGATPEAREYVRAKGLEDHVEFCDPAATDKELAEFLNRICVLAHANDAGESFGLAIAEAMAAGLPVVTHPSVGLKDNAQLELVEHGRTGFVATGTEDYAKAVAWLLNNPDKARAMGAAGQKKARTLFRVQTLTRNLEDLYLELLGTHPAHETEQRRAPVLDLHPGNPAL